MELASLLPKAGVGVGGSMDSDLGVIVDGPSAEDLGQSLVFTNSHHNGRTATHSYAHATANSYAHAASGGTTYAHAALVQLATHTVHTLTLVCTLLTHTSLCDYTDILYLYIQFLFWSSPSFQSSVLGSGFGSLNAPKPTPASDTRTPEQLNGSRLGQRASQMLATTSNSSIPKDAGPPSIQNPAPASSTSVEVKAQRVENGPVTAQHSKFTWK